MTQVSTVRITDAAGISLIECRIHITADDPDRWLFEIDKKAKESVSTLQTPSLGRVVMYKLTDAEKQYGDPQYLDNNGASECVATIVRVFSPTCVNVRLLTDSGESPPRRTSVVLGDAPGQWYWPKFVPPRISTPGDETQR